MDIIKKFNLPSYVKGKTFSEASALIAKRFEDRNSPEDIATLNDLQGRLQQAQEHIKAMQEARTKPQQVANIPADAGMGAEPSGSEPASQPQVDAQGNKLFLGGLLGGDKSTGAGAGAAGGGVGAGGYMQAATGAMDLANMAFGDTGIDTSGRSAAPDVPSRGASAASGAMKGAQAGMAFGPWGGAIGGVVGGVAGLIGGGKANREAEEAAFNNDLAQHNQASNSYKSGGDLLANMYQDGGGTDPVITEAEKTLKEMKHYLATGRNLQYPANTITPKGVAEPSNPLGTRGWLADQGLGKREVGIENTLKPSGLADVGESAESQLQKSATNALVQPNKANVSDVPESRTKFNPTELLRYAPAAMNLAQLANLKKPEKVGLDRLGNKYEEQLVDERELQNVVQEGTLNTRDALLSSSGGSGSTARANLLASQLQGTKALSQAYQSAGAENRQEKRKGQQFDLSVDQTNLGQSNQEKNINLQLDAGYKSNKSKLMAQLGDDLGGIGQEELFKRYPELMGLSYGARGQHLTSEEKKKAAKKAARKQKN